MCHRWFYCNSRNANFYLGPSVLKEVVVFVLNCRGAYNSFTVCACVRFGRLGSPTSEKVFALALLIYFADIWLLEERVQRPLKLLAPPLSQVSACLPHLPNGPPLCTQSTQPTFSSWGRGDEGRRLGSLVQGSGKVTPPGPGSACAARDVCPPPPHEPGPVVRGRSLCACSDSVASAAVGEGGFGLSPGGLLCAFPPLLCCHLRGP